MNDSSCRAWSDVEPVPTIPFSYLSAESWLSKTLNQFRIEPRGELSGNVREESVNIPKQVLFPEQVNQIENVHEVCLPPEVMEKILCYFDGDTLLKFKQLSKTCNDITNNAVRYYKLWKKICHQEIPKKYLIDLFTKQFDKKIPFDLISENHYETAYKNWLQWQNPVFKLSLIGQHDFLCLDREVKIICHKLNTMIVFSNAKYLFSITKNQNTEGYDLRNTNIDDCEINTLVVLNPRPETNQETGEDNIFITCHKNHTNVCPLHNTQEVVHDGDRRGYPRKLIDVDMNAYTNICCWVREACYEWYSDVDSKVVKGHLCPFISNVLFTSAVHGLIISRNPTNRIVIHGIHNNSCIMVPSWLTFKYMEAIAIYLYTNILFIATTSRFLLAYRLDCMDDLINLKDKNMLFKEPLEIWDQITMLDIMDFEGFKAIVVASSNTVLWFKIN